MCDGSLFPIRLRDRGYPGMVSGCLSLSTYKVPGKY